MTTMYNPRASAVVRDTATTRIVTDAETGSRNRLLLTMTAQAADTSAPHTSIDSGPSSITPSSSPILPSHPQRPHPRLPASSTDPASRAATPRAHRRRATRASPTATTPSQCARLIQPATPTPPQPHVQIARTRDSWLERAEQAVGWVAVEAVAVAVITSGRSRIGVPGGVLDVA